MLHFRSQDKENTAQIIVRCEEVKSEPFYIRPEAVTSALQPNV